jgi:protein-L-isoaspartate(D-aspartate) O-methyltransferase
MTREALLDKLKYMDFSDKILGAFADVKRENFIPENFKHLAYKDIALHIGYNQTISQPSTIAIMLSLLDIHEGQKVLEIGSGCGYVLALLSEIVGRSGKVFGIELVEELAEQSKKNLKAYENIEVHNRNGKFGLPKEAPFDRIILSAGVEEIPINIAIQLKEGGILVAPVGNKRIQTLIAIQKTQDKFIVLNKIPGFVFVPFVE